MKRKRRTPLPHKKYAVPEPVAVKVYPSGREVCTNWPEGKAEYRRRTEEIWVRDKGICCLCLTYVSLEQATFEHKNGRGMGGGRRDDRTKENGIAHISCNHAKGSMSYKSYMAIPLAKRMRNCSGH